MQYQFDGERERRAEFAMPKRTKQMGGIEQRLRIFVEDYTHLAEVYQYLAYGALEKENYEESFINMEKAAAEQKSWRRWSGNIMSLRGRGCF